VSIKHDLGTDYSLAETEPTFTGDVSKIKYTPLQTLNTRSTMAHVYEILEEQRDGAALITSISGEKVVGIVLWEQLHSILMKRNALA
jgi:CIC family chloride channel protein